ncbi:MAG: hypothetical protein ACK4FB_02535 [Brevundimonas sp.]|uniref:hypothetical protein n=1 Tax=Brevundimonas sp. TaxID=1871086 RepID=UPI00391D1C8A
MIYAGDLPKSSRPKSPQRVESGPSICDLRSMAKLSATLFVLAVAAWAPNTVTPEIVDAAEASLQTSANLAPISLCSAYADRMSFGGRTIAVEGVYESDELHSGFTSPSCANVGFGVRTGAMSPGRREALDEYLSSVRNGRRGGWVAYPIIFIGDLRPAGEFGGWELWVTDFSVP